MGIYDIYALWNTIQLVLEWCGSYNTHGKLSKTSRTVSYRIPYLSHKKLGAIISIQTSKRIQKKRTAKKENITNNQKTSLQGGKLENWAQFLKAYPLRWTWWYTRLLSQHLGGQGIEMASSRPTLTTKKMFRVSSQSTSIPHLNDSLQSLKHLGWQDHAMFQATGHSPTPTPSPTPPPTDCTWEHMIRIKTYVKVSKN